MPGSLLRILNYTLFTGCCFQTAQITNDVLADSLRELSPPEAVVAPAPSEAPPEWQERKAILDRNLFAAQLAGETELVEEEPEEEDLEETELPLVLGGTLAATGESSRAAIYDKRSRKSQVLRPGDEIEGHPNVTIDRIERRRVLILNKGKREELLLAEADPNRPAPKAESSARRPRRERAARNRGARQRAARQRERAKPPDDMSTRLQELQERVSSGELDLGALANQIEGLQPDEENDQDD